MEEAKAEKEAGFEENDGVTENKGLVTRIENVIFFNF